MRASELNGDCGLAACYEKERMPSGSYLCVYGLVGVFFVAFCCFGGLLCFTEVVWCDKIKGLLQVSY